MPDLPKHSTRSAISSGRVWSRSGGQCGGMEWKETGRRRDEMGYNLKSENEKKGSVIVCQLSAVSCQPVTLRGGCGRNKVHVFSVLHALKALNGLNVLNVLDVLSVLNALKVLMSSGSQCVPCPRYAPWQRGSRELAITKLAGC